MSQVFLSYKISTIRQLQVGLNTYLKPCGGFELHCIELLNQMVFKAYNIQYKVLFTKFKLNTILT